MPITDFTCVPSLNCALRKARRCVSQRNFDVSVNAAQ
jgi:hypothetical protein